MAYTVQMPALGESVTEGTITRWLKQEGDTVEVDEPLLEVSTDKVDTEIPSPQAGVLQRIVAQEDDTIEVGGDLAVIGDEGEGGGSGSSGDEAAESQESESQESESQESGSQGSGSQGSGSQESDVDTSEPEPEPAASSSSGGSPGGSGTTVEMPALGESVTEGTITRWLKQVGDTVEVDEPLLEVSTDKVDTEIPSPAAGTVLEHKAGEDDTVEVGGALAVIGDAEAAGGDAGSGGDGGTATQTGGDGGTGSTGGSSGGDGGDATGSGGDGGTGSTGGSSGADGGDATGSGGSGGAATQTSGDGDGGSGGSGGSGGDGGNGTSTGGNSAPYVTPLVRKLAAENDVDLSAISGSGVGGRIRKQDVLAAAEEKTASAESAASAGDAAATGDAAQGDARPSGGSGGGAVHAGAVQKPASGGAPAPDDSGLRGTTQKLSRRRATIAKRMVESLQVSAQLTCVVEADVTRIARLRDRAKADFQAREGVKLSFLPFMALATVEALKAHPKVNASIDTEAGEVTYHGAEHLGIAVDSEAGLIVPVVHDAGDLNLGGLARKIADVAERTRTNKIAPDELSGGTFTITNTGSRGALLDTPIINQPQVGILGTGAVVKKPMVVTDVDGDESIAVRSTSFLCLSYDHRLVDGADAARFLVTVKDRLEGGAFEGELGL